MNRLILGALGACFLTSTALAQSDATPAPPPAPMAGKETPPPPPGGSDAGGPQGDRDHGPWRKGPHGWAPHGPPPSRAAEFRFRRGPMEIRIKCSEDEAIKPCVDGAIELMHELAAMHGQPGAMQGAHARLGANLRSAAPSAPDDQQYDDGSASPEGQDEAE